MTGKDTTTLAFYGTERWRRIEIGEEMGGGYDGEPTRWLHVIALKTP